MYPETKKERLGGKKGGGGGGGGGVGGGGVVWLVLCIIFGVCGFRGWSD